jgi:hypothetical protein
MGSGGLGGACRRHRQHASTSFSVEKEAKRLLLNWTWGVGIFNAPAPDAVRHFADGDVTHNTMVELLWRLLKTLERDDIKLNR